MRHHSKTFALAFAALALAGSTAASAATIIHKYVPQDEGTTPAFGVVRGPDGNFYGTTYYGGFYQLGSLYRMTPAGVTTPVHSFGPSCSDGEFGNGLVSASDGNLYGVTGGGGSSQCDSGYGVVYRFTPATGAYTVIHRFDGVNGSYPAGRLLQADDGNLYGTSSDGLDAPGSIFRLGLDGTYTVLHQFTAAEGMSPAGGLVQGSDGRLYGMTNSGALGNGGIYRIQSNGEGFTLVHAFAADGSDGAGPNGELLLGHDGWFHGTTAAGGTMSCGTYGCGVVFKVARSGQFVVENAFTSPGPNSPLVQVPSGTYYGTTRTSIYKMNAHGVVTMVSTFKPASTTSGGTLAFDGQALLYGTTLGTCTDDCKADLAYTTGAK